MGDEQRSPVVAQTARPERRLVTVEDQAGKAQKGWLARFGVASAIVGCLTGVLGGAGAALGLWRDLVVTPRVRLDYWGDKIDVRWDTATRRLTFECWFKANNDGKMGLVRAARAHLTTGTGATLKFPQIDVKERGSGDSRPSFRLQQNEAMEVRVSVTSVLDRESELSFREGGLHMLVLDFEASDFKFAQKMPHCFWFGSEAAGDLASTGSLAIVRDDSRCMGGRLGS